MKVKKLYLLQLSATSISPVLGLLLSFPSVFAKSLNPLALSLSLALIFCYFPLMYDVSHSFFSYIDYTNGYLNEQLHALNVLAYILNEIAGLDYYYMVLLVSVTSFYLWFKMFLVTVGTESSQKYYVFVFFLFFLSLTYKESIDLNRTYIAYMIAVYAMFKYIDKPGFIKPGLVILFGISIYLHASSIVIPLAYILSKYIRISKKNAIVVFFVSILLSVTLRFFLQHIVIYIPQSSLLNYMVSETWGISKNISVGRALLWSIQAFVVVALYYASNPKSRQFSIFVMLSALFLMFIQFRVFGERFFIIVVLMMPLILSNVHRITKGMCVLLLAMLVKFLSYNFYIFGYIFTEDFNQVIKYERVRNDIILKPLILPTTHLLAIDEYGYSDRVIKMYSTRRELQ